eukprot:jgi/Orpsp1_1/1185428/evm.model.c7180000093719.1
MNKSNSTSAISSINDESNINSILKKSNSSLSNSNTNIKKTVSINDIDEIVEDNKYFGIDDYNKYDQIKDDDDDDPNIYLVKRNSLNTILKNNELPNSRQSSYLELVKTPSNESMVSSVHSNDNFDRPNIRETVEIILPETRVQKQVDPFSKFYKVPLHHPRVPIVFHNKIYPRKKEIMNIILINPSDCPIVWKIAQCNVGTVNYDPNNDELHEFQYSFRELYSSFSFNITNGVVEPFEKTKILLSFFPTTPGEYNQQWYLICKRTKILLEITGNCVERYERKKRNTERTIKYYSSEDSYSSSSEEEDIYSDLPYVPINIFKYDNFDDPMKNGSSTDLSDRFKN